MAIGEGLYIGIQFDQPIYGDVSANASSFTVTATIIDFATTGDRQVSTTNIPVIEVSRHPTVENAILLSLGNGNKNNLQIAAGSVTVSYRGGNLTGSTGPLLAFSESFEPSDVVYKGDQQNAEHIEVSSIVLNKTLTAVQYSYAEARGEHLSVTDASCSLTITHIDDI